MLVKVILLHPLELLAAIAVKLCIFIRMCPIYATKLLLLKVTKFTSHIHTADGE